MADKYRARLATTSIDGRCSVVAGLAQSVQHETLNLGVAVSGPIRRQKCGNFMTSNAAQAAKMPTTV